MNLLIAGSRGFIGSNLLSQLSISNFNIITIDIDEGVDLTKKEMLNRLPKFDTFIHLANLSYVPDSFTNPETFYRVNYLSTLNALELCRKNNAELIYLSSYIYGNPKYLPVDEKHPINPFNPYAQTKVICESLCRGYNRDFGVKSTILRPFNVYGTGQKGQLLLPEIFAQLKNGNKTIQLKDAKSRRDFVNVIDVAGAIIKSIGASKNFNEYNVCSGQSYSVQEITEIINSKLKNPVKFEFGRSDRLNEVNETIGSFDKIQKELSWSPNISLEAGIEALIKHNDL